MTRFRGLEFSGSSAPIQQELRAIEGAVGVQLPKDFKIFLRAANGLTLPYAVYLETPELEASLNFRHIFSVSSPSDSEESIFEQLVAIRSRWHIPREILPFAREDGSSVACLDLRDQNYGAVVALLAPEDYPIDPARLVEPPFVQVAPSFIEYINRLVPDSPTPLLESSTTGHQRPDVLRA